MLKCGHLLSYLYRNYNFSNTLLRPYLPSQLLLLRQLHEPHGCMWDFGSCELLCAIFVPPPLPPHLSKDNNNIWLCCLLDMFLPCCAGLKGRWVYLLFLLCCPHSLFPFFTFRVDARKKYVLLGNAGALDLAYGVWGKQHFSWLPNSFSFGLVFTV